MSYCEDCAVSVDGDMCMGTPGGGGSIKRKGRWWYWHGHSLETHFNHGKGYVVNGRTKSREDAVQILHAILNIAAVAREFGYHE